MVKKTVVISNPTGLHARPAGQFCEEAQKFTSNVTIKRVGEEKALNAKSAIHILTGRFACGTEVELSCNGDDEQQALEALVSLLESMKE